MRIHITERAAWVDAPDEFRSFDVATSMRGVDLEAAVAAQGLGRVDPDGLHVWLEPAAVIGITDRGQDQQWRTAFDDMMQYAAVRSWTDAEGRVRAHLT